MTYDTIEDAFLFVSSAAPFECIAVVHRKTGETFYASLMAGDDELPDDLDEWYVFEQQRTRQALLHWCEENSIELE